MRTHGTYQYIAPGFAHADARHGLWKLTLEPAASARAKRILGRVKQSRSDFITVAHTLEVARDLVWFMDRFPLEPVDARSAKMLAKACQDHIDRENAVVEIMAGGGARLDIPVDVAKTPREYQLQALQLIRTRNRIILGDDVGLGKTFTSLLTTTLPDALPVVVVPPTHLPRRWVTELQDAFPSLTYEVAKGTVPSKSAFAGNLADVTIVTYSKLFGWADVLSRYARTVIFDEAQELRHGLTTDKGNAAAQLAERATYVIGATATPVYNYGSEIHNLADILAPGELGTRDEFLREWGGATLSNGRAMVKNPAALGAYMRESGFLLARTRAEVGRELPKTIKHTMTVETDQAVIAECKADLRRLAQQILSAATDRQDRFQASGQIDWKLRQATGIAKAPFVAEFCKLLLESERKIIVAAWHREVHDILMRELAPFNPLLYTGTESPKQKAAAEEAFTVAPLDPNDPTVTQQQLDAENRVLIMSLRSGAGVDGLQKVAGVGVIAELDWSPATHEQFIGRFRRDGMNDEAPPVAYFLVTDDGSDPVLMETLGIKRNQAEPLISKDGQLFNNSTTDPQRAKALARAVLGLTDDNPA
ncbi:MAG: DEAD/DEAH box helicase [Microbacterium enclense]